MFFNRQFFVLQSAEGAAASAGGAPAAGSAPAGDAGGDHDIIRRLSQLVGDDGGAAADDAGDAGADDSRDDGPATTPQAKDAKPDAAQQTDAQPQAADDPVLTVKVNGAEKQVKQSELIAHYQKGDASAKRFEEAAQLRRQAEQLQATLSQEREQLAHALQTYTQQLQSLQQAQQPDWEHLLQEDPTEYVRQRHFHDQRMAQMQQAQAAQAYLQQQQTVQQQQAQQARIQAELGKLLDALPDWKDPTKGQAGRTLVRDSLLQAGFQPAEVDGLVDHRMVLVAHKAALYDRMVAEQAAARQNVQTKLANTPPARVERPGAGEVSPTDGRTQAMRRLSRTGKVTDAAAVIAQLL